jgi:hypothetical protein
MTKPFGSPDGFAMKLAVISSTSVFEGFGYANHSQSFFPRKRGMVSAPSLSSWAKSPSMTFVAGARSTPAASTTPRSPGPNWCPVPAKSVLFVWSWRESVRRPRR